MDNDAYETITTDTYCDSSTQPPSYQPLEHGYTSQAAPFTTEPYSDNNQLSTNDLPPPFAPPAWEMPYYPQPGIITPGYSVVYYQTPVLLPNQQQQQVFIVGNQPAITPVNVSPGSTVSFTGAIILSCLVFWFLGGLFGGIAFILAMVGRKNAARGNITGALRLRNASYALSITGIVVASVVIGVTLGLLTRNRYYDYYYYPYNYYYYNRYYYYGY